MCKEYPLYDSINSMNPKKIISWEIMCNNIGELEKYHKEIIASFIIHYLESKNMSIKSINIGVCKGGSGMSIPENIPDELKNNILKYFTIILSLK